MNKPVLYVDFNEMLEPNLVLLSVEDARNDIKGNPISLREGLEVIVYSDDVDENGNVDNLIGFGVVERNHAKVNWADGVRWCCRIDANGIRHESEL